MKRLALLALLLPVVEIIGATSTDIIVPEKCEKITRRSYFISRLERTMLAFKNFNERHARITIDETLFKHPELIETITLINAKNSLEPLFDLWSRLKEYKHIDDFLLMQEFTKLILVLPSQMQPAKKIADSIKTDIKLSLEGTSYIEAVTLRRYYTERLKKAVEFLHYVPCAKKDFFETAKPGCDCSFITNYEFNHAEIKKIIEEMNRENTLIPIIKLSQEFEKLKLISDADFQKQFMVLVFTTYRNLIINNAAKYQYPLKKSTLDVITYLYENIDRIPLEQILDAVDLLAEELPVILEKYEFKKEVSWQAWAKKYWWISSIAFTVLGYKVLRIFYPPKFRPGKHYQSGRPTSTNLLDATLP